MSIKDTAKSIIQSINDGDTLTTVSIGADSFHADTVKIAGVLLNKKLGGIYVTTSRPSSHIVTELEEAKVDLSDLYFVDLVSMKSIIWKDESLGAEFVVGDIPEDLVEQANNYREKMLETVLEMDDEALEQYLDGQDPSEDMLRKYKSK